MNCLRLRALFCAVVGATALGGALLAPVGAAAAEAAPAWEIIQATSPTNLVPGSDAATSKSAEPTWNVFLANVGSKVAGEAGVPVVVDTLPDGVAVASGTDAKIYMPTGSSSFTNEPCDVSGQTVTCEVTQPTSPGQLVHIAIPLTVAASASGPVTNQVSVSGGGVAAASSSSVATASAALPDFGFVTERGLRAGAFDAAGGPPNVAGSHPFMVELSLELNSSAGSLGFATPSETLRNLRLDLPGGLVANPAAVPVRCTTAQLASEESGGEGCPVASQVGVAFVEIPENGRGPSPLYAMVSPPGHPAEFAFSYVGVLAHVLGGVGGNLRLTAEAKELLAKFPIIGVDTFLWGVPSDPGHDSQRFGEGCRTQSGCSTDQSPAPFLTMPSSCTEPIELEGIATSWLGSEDRRSEPLTDLNGEPVQMTGCDSLAFEPSFEAKPTTDAGESPSGLDVKIHQPQDESLDGRATSTLKDVKVTLPEGMVLNAAASNGLSACTEEEIGYAPEGGKVRFSTEPQSCPDAAKVGTLEAETPLLDDKLPGAVYVAKPFDNPFGSLLAVYLAIESKKNGIYTKLAGKVEPDPTTGQLTATFTENPQLPIEDIRVHFFSGDSATLTTPLSCGTKTTHATLTPWSTPEGADANLTDSFQTNGSCSASEAAAPTGFGFNAGTTDPLAGAYSPFTLRLTRPDGSQHFTSIDTTLPEGLTGRLAGIPYCPEVAIAQAQSRSNPEEGKDEIASPSCPTASEVGTVTVGAGSGPSPTYVQGHAYLAGPYKGAPLSVAIVTPAVAGPFDLGVVVVRAALYTNLETAQITAKSDPLPTILHGIPLDVRSIALQMGRPGFTLNPTDCEPSAVQGLVATAAGGAVPVASRFQVGGCGSLAFKPKLKLQLKGGTTRSAHPALKAVLTMPPGGANIASVQVGLPHSEFLDQSNLNKVCLQADLKADTCPPSAVYGKARAWSPLLAQPLEGPVYIGAGYGHTLPDLVADLNGQIRILPHGRVDTTRKNGLRNTFEVVPDAPVSRFVLQLKGGKKYGLLENSENLCRRTQRASVRFVAQNGKIAQLHPKIANGCGKHKKKRKHKRHGRHKASGHKSRR